MNAAAQIQHDRHLTQLKATLGTHILNALNDPMVVEIMLNPDGKLWLDVVGTGCQDTGYTIEHADNIMSTLANMLKTTCDAGRPILEGKLPLDGSRFEGIRPPLVDATSFALRKRPAKIFTLQDYVIKEILDGPELANGRQAKARTSEENWPKFASQHEALSWAVGNRKNILIVGSTGSGKTTFANALIAEVERTSRVVIIEDTPEVQCSAPNRVQLLTNADIHIDMTRLLKVTMRLRPDRIVVGEVRDHAALALLKAWNTGHPGGFCTIHADSAIKGLSRLRSLVMEAENHPREEMASSMVAEAIHVVVFIEKCAGPSGRRVSEVIRVHGYDAVKREFQVADIA